MGVLLYCSISYVWCCNFVKGFGSCLQILFPLRKIHILKLYIHLDCIHLTYTSFLILLLFGFHIIVYDIWYICLNISYNRMVLNDSADWSKGEINVIWVWNYFTFVRIILSFVMRIYFLKPQPWDEDLNRNLPFGSLPHHQPPTKDILFLQCQTTLIQISKKIIFLPYSNFVKF